MGKGTDLWDDSALINAFDHAMATYKEMHSNGDHGNSAKEGNHTSDGNERDLLLIEKEAGHVEAGDNNNNISGDATETCVPYDNTEVATDNLSNQGNNFVTDLHASESEPCSSGFLCTDGKTYSYSDQQSEDYAQLLRQYYELEDQKQKIVQQLHQANYWNYQTPVQSSTCQLPQVFGHTVSEHGVQTPYSLCSCHFIAIPLIPAAYTGGGLSAGGYSCASQLACCSGSQAHQFSGCPLPAHSCQHSAATISVNCSQADDNAVKVGMLAVERAVISMKAELSATSIGDEGSPTNPRFLELLQSSEFLFSSSTEKKEKDVNARILEGGESQCISSDTDLTAVLNAWYMARQASTRAGTYHSSRRRMHISSLISRCCQSKPHGFESKSESSLTGSL